MSFQERRLSFALVMFAAIICLLLLAGCGGQLPPPPIKVNPVCEVLIGPIKYNTDNDKKHRFAGAALAVDLKKRNQVGTNLHCPQYRKP